MADNFNTSDKLGNPDGQSNVGAIGMLVLGDDGSNLQTLSCTASGVLRVDGSGVTQPISAAALPLPTGASTDRTTAAGPFAVRLSDGSAFYDGTKTGQLPAALVSGRLDVNIGASSATVPVSGTVAISGSVAVTNAGTFAVQDSEKIVDNAAFTDGTSKVQPAGYIFDEVAGTALTENDAAAARVDSKRAQVHVIEDETTRGRRLTITATNAAKVDGSAVTQPISAASLPLPTGAATETTLAAINTKIPASPSTDRTTAGAPFSVRLSDGSAFYDGTKTGQLPAALVSGRLDINIGASSATVPVSLATVAVTNAGTFAVQDSEKIVDNAAFTDGTSKVQPAGYIFDEVAGTALTENDAAAARVDSKRAQVHVIEDETTRGRRLTITATNAAKVDGSAVTQPISAAALPLPSGAATEVTLAAINTKIPASPATDRSTAGAPFSVRLSDGSAFYDGTKTGQLPAALVSGRLDVNIGASSATVPVSGTVAISGSVAVTNAGTFPVQDSEKIVDNAAFTDGASKVQPAGYIFDEVAGTALTENDAAAARIDAKRAIVNVIEDATTRGQRMTVSAAGAAKVDGSGVTQPVSGTVAVSGTVTVANGGTFLVQDSEKLTDNGAFVDGASKVMVAGYIFDEVAGTALAENDAAAARVDAKRAVINVIEDATTRGTRATVKAASTAAVAADPALVVAVSPNNTLPVNITSITTYSGKTVNRAVVSANAAGTLTLAAASGGNKHKVVGAVLTMDIAGTIKFGSGAGPSNLTGAMNVGATGGFVLPTNLTCPYVETVTGELLALVTTTGVTNGVVLYITEP